MRTIDRASAFKRDYQGARNTGNASDMNAARHKSV